MLELCLLKLCRLIFFEKNCQAILDYMHHGPFDNIFLTCATKKVE